LCRFDGVVIRLHAVTGRILRRLHPEWHARFWSNSELRWWGQLVTGDVINVSGWRDNDKFGGRYADYFPNKSSYTISNAGGARGVGDGRLPEIYLDLALPLSPELRRRYDVVLNHTTLEHVYDIRLAVHNLCELSRDLVMTITPFLQCVHWEEGSYLDYWRPTPFAMQQLFSECGFDVIHCSYNDNPVHDVYMFTVASRQPQRWSRHAQPPPFVTASHLPGRCWYEMTLPHEPRSLETGPTRR
jgi:hypothetical protein